MSEKESLTQRAILDYLAMAGFTAWRCALAGVKFQGFRAKNPMTGHPDIAGVFQGGQYFVVEVKAEAGRLSPAQVVWRDRLQAKGVFYILARSVQDVADALAARRPSSVTLTPAEKRDAIESLPDFRGEEFPY